MGRKAVYTVISIKGRWAGKKEGDRWEIEKMGKKRDVIRQIEMVERKR